MYIAYLVLLLLQLGKANIFDEVLCQLTASFALGGPPIEFFFF
jgi:hypothetical protein